MSIPKSILLDIGGKEVLKFEAVFGLLKCDEEKENLFANFPMGTTIQDGGKRKRSVFDNSRLWKTIKHYGRIREYRKEKLDNISK